MWENRGRRIWYCGNLCALDLACAGAGRGGNAMQLEVAGHQWALTPGLKVDMVKLRTRANVV